jgi:hypothetical protein
MIVRIRFGHGRRVTRRNGKNGRAARVTASLLGLVAICLGIFGFWRLGEDLGFTGDFVFSTGFLSHWQVWMAAAAATQYACLWLTRYSKQTANEMSELAEDEVAAEKITAEKISARV